MTSSDPTSQQDTVVSWSRMLLAADDKRVPGLISKRQKQTKRVTKNGGDPSMATKLLQSRDLPTKPRPLEDASHSRFVRALQNETERHAQQASMVLASGPEALEPNVKRSNIFICAKRKPKPSVRQWRPSGSAQLKRDKKQLVDVDMTALRQATGESWIDWLTHMKSSETEHVKGEFDVHPEKSAALFHRPSDKWEIGGGYSDSDGSPSHGHGRHRDNSPSPSPGPPMNVPSSSNKVRHDEADANTTRSVAIAGASSTETGHAGHNDPSHPSGGARMTDPEWSPTQLQSRDMELEEALQHTMTGNHNQDPRSSDTGGKFNTGTATARRSRERPFSARASHLHTLTNVPVELFQSSGLSGDWRALSSIQHATASPERVHQGEGTHEEQWRYSLRTPISSPSNGPMTGWDKSVVASPPPMRLGSKPSDSETPSQEQSRPEAGAPPEIPTYHNAVGRTGLTVPAGPSSLFRVGAAIPPGYGPGPGPGVSSPMLEQSSSGTTGPDGNDAGAGPSHGAVDAGGESAMTTSHVGSTTNDHHMQRSHSHDPGPNSESINANHGTGSPQAGPAPHRNVTVFPRWPGDIEQPRVPSHNCANHATIALGHVTHGTGVIPTGDTSLLALNETLPLDESELGPRHVNAAELEGSVRSLILSTNISAFRSDFGRRMQPHRRTPYVLSHFDNGIDSSGRSRNDLDATASMLLAAKANRNINRNRASDAAAMSRSSGMIGEGSSRQHKRPSTAMSVRSTSGGSLYGGGAGISVTIRQRHDKADTYVNKIQRRANNRPQSALGSYAMQNGNSNAQREAARARSPFVGHDGSIRTWTGAHVPVGAESTVAAIHAVRARARDQRDRLTAAALTFASSPTKHDRQASHELKQRPATAARYRQPSDVLRPANRDDLSQDDMGVHDIYDSHNVPQRQRSSSCKRPGRSDDSGAKTVSNERGGTKGEPRRSGKEKQRTQVEGGSKGNETFGSATITHVIPTATGTSS